MSPDHNELEWLCEVPHGTGENISKGKAEGLAILDDQRLLVVFDSPTDACAVGENDVQADVMRIMEQF